MKINASCLSFSAQHNRQAQRISEQRAVLQTPMTPQAGALTTASATRVALNSSQWQTVNLYSSSGATIQQQQWHQQEQFNRFYSSNVLSSTDTAYSGTGSVSTSAFSASSYYQYQESQSSQIMITGSVSTEELGEIQFQFSADVGSNFVLEIGQGEYAERVATRTDPLIINYGGGFNNLSQESYDFDLNADGKDETISFAGAGSGFLAWDKNGDGIINDGSELFGTRSGDGFADLAALDEDGNGFIDAGDSVFSQLQIYEKSRDGQDSLKGLASFDIAAISFQSVATPFRITDHLNQERGMAQATGVFLRNDGSVGSVQQIDLTQRDPESEQRMIDAFAKPSDNVPTPENDADNQDLDSLMQQLEQARQSRLDRQQALADQEEHDDEPKSLLEQLVDQLEEYTVAQRSHKEDD